MKPILITILLLGHLYCLSQKTDKPKKLSFHSINQVGFVHGEATSELIIQSINGFRFHSFFVGAGLGLDYYKERSVPIFLDIRKNIFNTPNTPFIYVDGGYHAIWSKEDPEEWISQGYKGGLYYEAGIGYSFPVFKASAFIISLGYSEKKMSEKRNRTPWISSWPQPDDFEKLEYKLRRYSFKMGLAF